MESEVDFTLFQFSDYPIHKTQKSISLTHNKEWLIM
jgi:hypothetical protein